MQMYVLFLYVIYLDSVRNTGVYHPVYVVHEVWFF